MNMRFLETCKDSIIRDYANFHGRMSRSNFTQFAVCLAAFWIVLTAISWALVDYTHSAFGLIPATTFLVIIFIPSLSAQVRRLHDANRSGYWAFIQIIPYIGILFVVALFFMRSKNKGSRFDAPMDSRKTETGNPEQKNQNSTNDNHQVTPMTNKWWGYSAALESQDSQATQKPVTHAPMQIISGQHIPKSISSKNQVRLLAIGILASVLPVYAWTFSVTGHTHLVWSWGVWWVFFCF
jgi:uncharacterized membrane protein YhaH (DUF805 family)